jgi:glycolate dehydrogenase FAD-binding subunit
MVVTAPAAIDGLREVSRMEPVKPQEVADLLAGAARENQAIVPVGGGRALGMGNVAERCDALLLTHRLDRVLSYRPADLTVTVEAGLTLEALAELTRGAGQMVALDAYGGPGHTVGGVLAAGWSGPQRLTFGPARDQVLGITVAVPRQGLLRLGGSQIKNVSGYDMPKLHVGALGTLGVIVEATLRARPLTAAGATLETAAGALESAWAAAERAMAQRSELIAVLVARDENRFRVLARLAGPAAGVRAGVRGVGWHEAEAGAWESLLATRSTHWARISVPPAALPPLLGPLTGRWLAEPGTGVAHWLDASEPSEIASVRAAAEAAGGSLVLLAAPLATKRSLGAWGSPPSTVEVMRRLRMATDPDRILSPGRFLV